MLKNGILGDYDLCNVLTGRNFIHYGEHDVFKNCTQSSCARVAEDGKMCNFFKCIFVEFKFNIIHFEKAHVLLYKRIFGLGKDAYHRFLGKLFKRHNYWNPADEFGNESELKQILGQDVLKGFADILFDIGANIRTEAHVLFARAFLNNVFNSRKCAAADEQDICCVYLNELLMRVLPAALRGDGGNGAFKNFQQSLLNTLARYIACNGRVFALAGNFIDFIDVYNAFLCALNIIVAGLQKLEQNVFNILAEIDRIDTELARLLELRFDLCEEIGRYKRMNGLPIENCEREKELVAARTEGMLSHRSDAVAVFRMIIRRAKRIQKEKLNLYLVGMPGSGKSRTARRLARAIEKPVADTDKLIIDKQGMSIDEIFDTHGEAFFREIESETLLGVAERGGHVVATGGGILTVERNIPIIKGSGIVVFLNRDISILLNAKTANRPLIRGGREAVLKLYAERIETYRKCSDLIVNPDSAGCIGRILDYYKRITE